MRQVLASVVAATLLVAPIAAQQKPEAKAKYRAPRTAWGDPDLSGTYTNKYEIGTPFEKPDEFAGRNIGDVGQDELKAILARRQQTQIERLPFVSGDPEGRIGPPAESREIYDIDKGSRPWLVVDPPDGKIPPQTPDVAKRLAARQAARLAAGRGRGPADSYEDRSLYDQCITRGFPGSMLPAIYGNSYEILQGPGYVAIRYEMIHETRLIPLDGRPHPRNDLRFDMGDARGRFEGDALVVETTNFTDRSAYRNADGATLKLTERFTPTAPDKVEWAVTVDDPHTWTRPWTFSMPLTKDAREAVFEYGCHEGNYALRNILSAARAEDKEGAFATAK